MLEKDSYLNLLEECFPGIKTNMQRCDSLGFPWQSKAIVKDENGQIVSHVGVLDYPILIKDKLHKVGALHAICTKKGHRNRGLASELIQEALRWAEKHYEFVILFTEIPSFYEKLSFRTIPEHRFRLPYRHAKGSRSLTSLVFPRDNSLILRSFRERTPLSSLLWMKDNGDIACFNALFATFPTYWSLHYSPSIDGILSFSLKDKTLHLFDLVAKEMPPLDLILDHLPEEIEEIYFYFSPDRLTKEAISEPYVYEKSCFMVRGNWPYMIPFMISPLSRC